MSLFDRRPPQEPAASRLEALPRQRDGADRVDERGLPGGRLRLRPARPADVPALVDVDLRAFGSVYREYGQSPEALRERLCELFERRLERLGPEWTPVLWQRDRVAGFLMGCRTGRTTADFRTWEEMTDGGSLESTHDPHGRNLYIVTLSMLPAVSAGPGRSMLFANQIAAIIRHDIGQVFFESRLPGLRGWLARQCARQGRRIGDLTDAERRDHAETYLRLTRTVNGREVPQDHLLTVYHHAGARFVRLIENGYQDAPSLNFGVLCVLPNPAPAWVQRRGALRTVAGRTLGLASRSPLLMRGAFAD